MAQKQDSQGPVLLSWVAVNNDPYERERGTGVWRRDQAGQHTPGPTLTLLFDEQSKYRGQIKDFVLFHRIDHDTGAGEEGRSARAARELKEVLRERDPQLKITERTWAGEDPTDHHGIFEFLRVELPKIRKIFPGRRFVIHLSPGTPSMHTIWVLLAETVMADADFSLVMSARPQHRRDDQAVMAVEVGARAYFKSYQSAHPHETGSEEQQIAWDPAQFRSERMKQLYAQARRYAQLKVPILIRGERGTGKTTLANWIRSNSPFRRVSNDQDWPSIACGQYTNETMRSELFGHEKGAFTGALGKKEGLLVKAHEDTLFLDEIGDVSPELQRLLIRAIEERSFYPLGAEKAVKSDFRLISATNIDDETLKNRLDADFLDRISLFRIQLPPLREIPEELEWLWPDVYEDAQKRAGIADRRQVKLNLQDHARIIKTLRHHPLPGNMRDLFRVAYRILAARADPSEALSSADATGYGLELLEGSAGAGRTQAHAIGRAWVEGRPLDALLPEGEVLQTKQISADLQRYLAQELRRIAEHRGVKVETLCDVTDRTLRNWLSDKS